MLAGPQTAWPGFDAPVAVAIEKAVPQNIRGGDVVFDADGTLWPGDIGESFFVWQLENKKFTPQQNVKAEQMWQAYRDKRIAERDMWIAAATLQSGLREADVKQWAREFFRDRFRDHVFPAM